jgi:hypothetical protein
LKKQEEKERKEISKNTGRGARKGIIRTRRMRE